MSGLRRFRPSIALARARHVDRDPLNVPALAVDRRKCARRQKSLKRVDMVKDGRAANA